MIIAPFNQFVVTKAWIDDGTLYREGWISTNDRDREKDISEPEAFQPVLDSYFSAGAPVSNTHDTRSMPVGHLQKGALVRDGQIFHSSTHPTDPADFTAFPESGTGFYARIAINDPIAASQVAKGNIGGCSFIAGVSKSEPLPGGGRRFLEFSHLMETTIAAYPINPKAVMSIAKAYGYDTPQEKEETPKMTPEEMQAVVKAALAQIETEKEEARKAAEQQSQIVTIDQLNEQLAAQKAAFDAELRKATELSREGTGRVAQQPENERDANPVDYIVQKAAKPEELTAEDKDLIMGFTLKLMLEGLQD